MNRQDLKNQVNEYVNQSYLKDIKWNMRSRTCWQFTSNFCETLGYILLGLNAILAFAADFFDYMILSFIAGCLSVSSMVILKFSSYASRESSERVDRVNKILEEIGVDEIVDTNDIDEDNADHENVIPIENNIN